MYTYNITFVTGLPGEKELLDYLQNKLIPLVLSSESSAYAPELKKIVEVGGETPNPDHGVSVALSVAFQSMEDAHEWHDRTLLPALKHFHLTFGTQAVFFITLLENISLEKCDKKPKEI